MQRTWRGSDARKPYTPPPRPLEGIRQQYQIWGTPRFRPRQTTRRLQTSSVAGAPAGFALPPSRAGTTAPVRSRRCGTASRRGRVPAGRSAQGSAGLVPLLDRSVVLCVGAS